MNGIYLVGMNCLLCGRVLSEAFEVTQIQKGYLPIESKSTTIGALICKNTQVLVINTDLDPR